MTLLIFQFTAIVFIVLLALSELISTADNEEMNYTHRMHHISLLGLHISLSIAIVVALISNHFTKGIGVYMIIYFLYSTMLVSHLRAERKGQDNIYISYFDTLKISLKKIIELFTLKKYN